MTNFPKGTALITGASSGIGALYADKLARRGYDLILVARSQDSLTRIGKDIAAATGRNVSTVRADLGQRDDLLSPCLLTMPALVQSSHCSCPTLRLWSG
jgi:short-subunit dehydrogenase